MSMLLNTITCGDIFNAMPNIADKSIDMILTDIPYNTTACDWDKEVIPLDKLWEGFKRIIKDNGAIVMTASQPFTSRLVMSNLGMFKYEWIWDKQKGSGSMLAKIMPMKSHENILIFGNKIKYNPIKELAKKENRRDRIKNCSNPLTNEIYGKLSGYAGTKEDDLRNPKTIISISSQSKELHQGKRRHPTQKPVALFEYLIKTYTNEGDTVFDGFAGSGTTGVACQNLNRKFILIEKEDRYCKIARDRLKQCVLKL